MGFEFAPPIKEHADTDPEDRTKNYLTGYIASSKVRRLLDPLRAALAVHAAVALRECQSQIGSGSLPVDRLPSWALVLTPRVKGKGEGTALKALEKRLRELPVPVIGRLHEGALWLDLRCLEDEPGFVAQLAPGLGP